MASVSTLPGLELPIIQAPMAGVQDEALAIAVSEAGGLGSMPCALLSPARLETALARFAALPRPINLNFFCHSMTDPDPAREHRWQQALAPYYREFGIQPPAATRAGARRPIDAPTVDLLERYRPRIVSFHFGLPAPPLLQRIKAWGATVLASATTREEGLWLETHGADIVIAQGIEAGGHRGCFLSEDMTRQPSTFELVHTLSKALSVPVIAAGGTGERSDVESMLAAGAAAVQVGTAYLSCPEATTTAVHRAALRQSTRQSAITNLFSGRPARGLMNRLMRELGPLSDLPPEFPWASQALAPLRNEAEARGLDDFTPLWSGTRHDRFFGVSAALVTRRLAGID
ncbi:nitronate monooxygenase [Lysobacter sp. Root494]|uniref:NAD(P)H-dependent flavin oxidoreductase n=1 Tax=Lysobacter sp. Root494 TaxID=1736549 RepID=UPI0006FA15B9|nr:nitronate monooxygenase [Lysobacter sp. Root494]KQY52627.1 2-nitropropane dioxygenase [Lysobacter sp. Root494]